MCKFFLKTDDSVLEIDGPDKDQDNWIVTEAESFRVDRKQFILDLFIVDFPDINVESFDMLSKLISRSTVLADWYTIASAKYSQTVQLPLYLKEITTPEKFISIQNKLKAYNELLSDEGRRIQKASERFKEEIKTIKESTEKSISKLVDDQLIYVITLNVNKLPISLQLEIERFTPKNRDDAHSKDKFARELLICYQRKLIEVLNNDPNIDIKALINQLSVK